MSSSKPLKSKDHTSSHLSHTPKSTKSSKNQNPSSSSRPPNPPKSSKTKKPSSSSSASQSPNSPQTPQKPKPSSSPHPQNPKKLEASPSPSPPSNPPKSQKDPKPNMTKDPDASSGSKGSAAAAAALLRAAAEFRSRTGASPTASTVGPFFESFKDSLIPLGITEAQIRNKIRHLRHRFNQAASKGDQDTPFYKLSLEAWGAPVDKSTTPHRSLRENNNLMDEDDYEQDEDDYEQDEEDDEDEDVGDFAVLYPIMTQQLSDYWKKNDLSEVMLEEKLNSIDPKKAREVEKMWVKHLEDGLKLREMQQNLNNEVCKLMRDACRRMSS